MLQEKIARMVAEVEKNIIDRKVDVAEMEKVVKFDFEEHFQFQQIKSELHASGLLSLDDAQYLYNVLGGTHNKLNKQPLALRVVLQKLLVELIEVKAKLIKRSA